MCTTDFDGHFVGYRRHVVGRKQHRCAECGAPIPKGEGHWLVTGIWVDGSCRDFVRHREHDCCAELKSFLEDVVCGGHGSIPLGGMVEEVHEAAAEYGIYLEEEDEDSDERRNPLFELVEEIRATYRAQVERAVQP